MTEIVRRPRRRRRPDTHERIGEAALELFSAKGFDGATMRELADRLDMTTAALYYHYADKGDILVQLVGPMFDDAEQLVTEAEQDDAPVEDRLAVVLDLLLEHRDVFRLVSSDIAVRTHPSITDRLDAHERRLFRFIAGSSGPRDAATVIRAVAAYGAMSRPILSVTHIDMAEHRELLLDAAVRAYDATGRRRRRALRATRDGKAG